MLCPLRTAFSAALMAASLSEELCLGLRLGIFHVRSFLKTAKEVLKITTHANYHAVCESYCPTVHPATAASSMLQVLVRDLSLYRDEFGKATSHRLRVTSTSTKFW